MIPLLIVAVLGTTWVVLTVVVGHYYSPPSIGMAPSYPSGSHIWGTVSGTPARGQVIVFKRPVTDPNAPSELFRRIVAVGGDTVTAANGHLVVNGHRVTEPYVARGERTTMIGPAVLVPAHTVFVMGDSRQISQDSRYYGPIPVSSIVCYIHFSL